MGGRNSHPNLPASSPVSPVLPATVHASRYQRRVAKLVEQVSTSPMDETLEMTLKRCIAFCYDVTVEWAPFVRVTVFADNVNEHQMNVPVLGAMLVCFGEPDYLREVVKCKAVPGTDVQDGLVKPSLFWTRPLPANRQLAFRSLAHALLKYFADLDNSDPRKQSLVNILLQMHEACFNCVGRHKEVFEYSIYDLLEAEEGAEKGDLQAMSIVKHHAEVFLDRHKRNALHAAFLSPLKYLFQDVYEIFENLDSHGASFWVSMLKTFFPDLDMPFEDIEQLDIGWSWGAIDFLPAMTSSSTALARFSDPRNLGLDWRSLTCDLPRRGVPFWALRRFQGLPFRPGPAGFKEALRRIKQQPAVRQLFLPYVERFTCFFHPSVLLQRWAFSILSSERWDSELGPALLRLSDEAPSTVQQLRDELCNSDGEVNLELASSLLERAEVCWAPLSPK